MYVISAASTKMAGHRGRLVNPIAGDTCTHFICDKDLTPLRPTVVRSREGGMLVSFQFLTTGLSRSPLTPILVPLCTGSAILGQKSPKVGNASHPTSPPLPRTHTKQVPLKNKTSPKIRSSWEAPHSLGHIPGGTAAAGRRCCRRAQHSCSKHKQKKQLHHKL